MASQACVLVSGGVESSILLADALNRHSKIRPVYVRNHLRWESAEIFWLRRFLKTFPPDRILPLKILEMRMGEVYHNHWSTTGKSVPGSHSPDEAVYLFGRNLILLSMTAVFASVFGASVVEIGVLKTNPFPDGTPDFFKRLGRTVSFGLGKTISIQAPFARLKKPQVIQKGRNLPLELTFSCINPKQRKHCGRCNKCVERKIAFLQAGITDKTRYVYRGMPG